MIKARVYLDTTIPSACLDERSPDRQRLTQEFWTDRLTVFEPVISVITLREIEDTPDPDRRVAMQQMVSAFPVLPFDEEAYALAQVYVERGIFPDKYASDANHVAIAVVSSVSYFASWNFKHLVRVSTRREVNLLNALEGYGNIEIVAPPEM